MLPYWKGFLYCLNYLNREDNPNRTCKEHDLLLGLGFIAGYKAASKNKWSDEDMRRMYDLSCGNIGLGLLEDKTEDNNRFNSFLQSLSPVTLPIGFKPEFLSEVSAYYQNGLGGKEILKTIKNEAGIEVLQGEWIYQQ